MSRGPLSFRLQKWKVYVQQSRDGEARKAEVMVKVFERFRCNVAFASEFLISAAKSPEPSFLHAVISCASFLSGWPFEVKV